MPLLAVKMPPNVIIVFKGFSDIVNMKIIDPKQVYGWITSIGSIWPNEDEY
jgi:hypothetical protein